MGVTPKNNRHFDDQSPLEGPTATEWKKTHLRPRTERAMEIKKIKNAKELFGSRAKFSISSLKHPFFEKEVSSYPEFYAESTAKPYHQSKSRNPRPVDNSAEAYDFINEPEEDGRPLKEPTRFLRHFLTAQSAGENHQLKKRVTYIPKELDTADLFSRMRISAGENFHERLHEEPIQFWPYRRSENLVKDEDEDRTTTIRKIDSGEGNQPGMIPGDVQKLRSFGDFNLHQALDRNLGRMGLSHPTPIQRLAFPILRSGKDLIARGKTGSGKTIAYLLPIMQFLLLDDDEDLMPSLATEGDNIRCLIVAPTRELTIQIGEEAKMLAHETGLRIGITYGQVSVDFHRNKVKGVQLLVATVGRLHHFLTEEYIDMSSLKYFVMDEADKLIDPNFEEKLLQIASLLPEHRVTAMFSATVGPQVYELATRYGMSVDHCTIQVGDGGQANPDIHQRFFCVVQTDKKMELKKWLTENFQGSKKKVLVFVERRRQADFMGLYLSRVDFPATTIHGGRHQWQRELALNQFKSGEFRILIATSCCARGLDIHGVDVVINYDLPVQTEDYVHRIGRTGRVGNPGLAVSYFDSTNPVDVDNAPAYIQILSKSQQDIPDWMMSFSGHQRPM